MLTETLSNVERVSTGDTVSSITKLIQGFEKDPGEDASKGTLEGTGEEDGQISGQGVDDSGDGDDLASAAGAVDDRGDTDDAAVDQPVPADAVEGEADDEPKEGPVGEIGTVQDFVEASGWELEDFYALKMKLRSGGEVTIGEVKDQLQQIPEMKAALDKEKSEFELSRKQWQDQASQGMAAVQGVSKEFMEAEAQTLALVNQYNAVDWAKFEREKPGEAALAKQNMEEAYRTASFKREKAQNAMVQTQQQAMQQKMGQEVQQALTKHEAWKDKEVFATDLQAMDDLMGEYGFQKGSIGVVSDHRQLLMMKELVELRQKVAKAAKSITDSVTNRKPPRTVRGGKAGKQLRQQAQKTTDEKQIEKIRGADNRSKAAFISQNLLNGT